jgi:hypothetical protein
MALKNIAVPLVLSFALAGCATETTENGRTAIIKRDWRASYMETFTALDAARKEVFYASGDSRTVEEAASSYLKSGKIPRLPWINHCRVNGKQADVTTPSLGELHLVLQEDGKIVSDTKEKMFSDAQKKAAEYCNNAHP